ncbi:MAG: SRPBCC domain-containing protein [Betaproteobacteria bacterium]
METATEDKTSLHIRRLYQAPVAAVWAAWTDAEQMKQWMGPSDAFGESEVTMDVRVGGRYRIVMHAPDGETHRVGGVYREVVPNQKLVYTWAWESTPEQESLVTLEFKPSGDGTELVLAHQRFADTQARDKHQEGWIGCLDRLGRFVSHASH